MRIVPFLVNAAVTTGLITVLSIKIGSNPPVGELLSPTHGFWKNAEPDDFSFSAEIASSELKDQVTVSLDERLVPHVFAKNDHDAYLVQGYLHARFRLWQMEFQTYAAAGRLSEILGEKVGNNSVVEKHDRRFRRMGMVYGAENSLRALNEDPAAKEAVEAYTRGVNLYIHSLKPAEYPIEYKLLGYAPEDWSPLKTALIIKYMSYDLTSDFDDFGSTQLVKELGLDVFDQLNPIQHDSVSTIASKGTVFTASRPLPIKPPKADSLMGADTGLVALRSSERDMDDGSNNWVVSGKKTASGRPILCDDMHLGLNLPSLWYEIQVHTPQYNCYGVSLPGAPFIIVGFNDSIAWGLTNASRDVMDFYEVKFRDSTRNEYWFDSSWKKTEWRDEVIKVKGKPDYIDHVAITLWGPVMYDATYESKLADGKSYAIRWTAHDKSAEYKTFQLMNRARNYNDYLEAIKHFSTPAQNFAFASKRNNIALWQAGKFPAKWKHQGDFIMPGTDSAFMWQGYIPFEDLVHELNPPRGFVSSANQLATDTSYPYYLGGFYDMYRGFMINRILSKPDSTLTPADMQKMQTSNYDVFAEMALPLMVKYVDTDSLNAGGKTLLELCISWNRDASADENGKTVFENWWANFKSLVYKDELMVLSPESLPEPSDQTLLQGLVHDSTAYKYLDNKKTPAIETLQGLLTVSLNNAASSLSSRPNNWGAFKKTMLTHLLKIPAFNLMNLNAGGGRRIINATKDTHGPSWRMVVHLTDETEAYGVYPGGQVGNPGSKYYTQFADSWVKGRYYRLWQMKESEMKDERVKFTIHFSKS